jgi:hypothetical protein
MVTIRTNEEIEEFQTCELFDCNDNLIGTISSSLIMQDICVQIKEQQLDGYYIIYDSIRCDIENNGRLHTRNVIVFPAIGNLLRKLI